MKPTLPPSKVHHLVTDCILIVDDEPEIVRLVQLLLHEIGATVHGATDGADALRFVREHGMPRLILLDLQMPVMDGPTFVAFLRQEFANPAPIVIVSAAMDVHRTAARLQADGVLTKPFQGSELISTVLDLLKSPPL